MSEQNGNMEDRTSATAPHIDETTTGMTHGLVGKGKGKGKAVDPIQDVEMGEDEEASDEDEEEGEDEQVS
jgi:hypothetical protein